MVYYIHKECGRFDKARIAWKERGGDMNTFGKWMKTLVSDGSFDEYYGRIIRKGGPGLPTASEARKDLERARRAIDPRFPL